MLSFIQKLIGKIPAPWRYVVYVVILAVVLIVFFALMNQVQSCGYSKARKDYEAKDAALKTEYDRLSGENKQLKTEIASLEPQLLAYKSAQEAGKKVDDGLAKQIEEVGKESAKQDALTEEFADCEVRADRTCAKLRGLKPPIQIDCDAYRRKICQQ